MDRPLRCRRIHPASTSRTAGNACGSRRLARPPGPAPACRRDPQMDRRTRPLTAATICPSRLLSEVSWMFLDLPFLAVSLGSLQRTLQSDLLDADLAERPMRKHVFFSVRDGI